VRLARLHVLYRGIYAVGHPVLTAEGRWMAAVLATGPGAVLSHRAGGLARSVPALATASASRVQRPPLRGPALVRVRLLVAGGAAHRRARRPRGASAAFERDRARDRTLNTSGWRVVRVTWRQLCEEPEALAADLAKMFRGMKTT
jgi:hypothetical protein